MEKDKIFSIGPNEYPLLSAWLELKSYGPNEKLDWETMVERFNNPDLKEKRNELKRFVEEWTKHYCHA